MDIRDFSRGTPWAIIPSHYEHLGKEFKDLKRAEGYGSALAAFGSMDRNGESLYEIVNGVAILRVFGALSKRQSYYSTYFGGCGFNVLTEMFLAAQADPKVRALVLDIDSPGGTVSGTEAFTDTIFNARGNKPVVAFGNGMMGSAAYWAGSAADHIICESTADIGSIGVLMVHYDYSKWDENAGLKTTYITAGKYKGIGNDAEPLGELGLQVFQEQVDYTYALFINTVARNRGVDADKVGKEMADGRTFIGQQALDVGLVDGIGSLETAIEKAGELIGSGPGKKTIKAEVKASGKGVIMPGTANGNTPETVDHLTAMYPDLVKEVREQGAAEVDTDTIRQEATTAENKRIMGMVTAYFGEDAAGKFVKVVASGVDAEQLKTISGLVAPQAAAGADENAAILEAIQNAGAGDPGHDQNGSGPADFKAAYLAIQEDKGCTRTKAISLAAKQYPDLHKAYIAKANTKQ